jgi:phenylacetate-CoA ligase
MEHMLRVGTEDYSPFLIEHFLMEIPEVGLWYHLKLDQGVLTIEAEKFRTKLSDEQLAAKIQKHMADRIGIHCEVVIRHDIPRTFGKATRVFN